MTLYDLHLTLPLIRGDDLALDTLAGKVVLVINVASH